MAAEKRSDDQRRLLLDEYTKTDPREKSWLAAIAELQAKWLKLNKSLPRRWSCESANEPRETHLLIRGEYLRNGPVVAPGVPAVLPPLPADRKNPTRLDLARWLVDPANPLTARVTVNRIWQQYFGRGLVETSNDFGTQGAAPIASRVARLAGRRIYLPRLEHEIAPPVDRDFGHVSAIIARAAGTGTTSTRTICCSPAKSGCESRPKSCAI